MSQLRYTQLLKSVVCIGMKFYAEFFFKYADRINTEYAAEIWYRIA